MNGRKEKERFSAIDERLNVMSIPGEKSEKTVHVVDLSMFRFIRLFKGFFMSIQPMKIVLAIMIILSFYLVGGIMDFIAGEECRVLSDDVYNFNSGSEITWVAENRSGDIKPDMDVLEFRRKTVDGYTEELRNGLITHPMLQEIAGDNPLEIIRSGRAYSLLKEKYREVYDKNHDLLEQRYAITIKNTEEGFDKRKSALAGNDADFDFQKRRLVEEISDANLCLQKAMVSGNPEYSSYEYLNKVIVVDVSIEDSKLRREDSEKVNEIKENVNEVIQLARYMKVAKAIEGRGVFSALADFKLRRIHELASGLVLLDFEQVKNNFFELVYAASWMVRYHPLYTSILFAAGFAIYALFGGAICRISALQVTRDERIGPMEALKFSGRRFWRLFFVPVTPVFIILIGIIAIAIISWFFSLPFVGQVLQALFMPIIFLIGFLVTVVVVLATAGYGLMFPAVAVDNSEAFDAMSRSFSYVLNKPWHAAFYAFLSAVYGIICYIFLRFFIFILFFCMRAGISLVLDGDLLWPEPIFSDFMPPIQWHLLSTSQAVSAVMFRIATVFFVLVLPGYGLSFFYTMATQVYVLLRKDEDEVDMEECYLETHISDLFTSTVKIGAEEDKAVESESEAAEQDQETTEEEKPNS